MDKNARIFVAGHNGMVGSAIVRALKSEGYLNLLTADKNDLDLAQKNRVMNFFMDNNPEYVFLAAAKVGGIHANDFYSGDFIRENLNIQTSVIHASYKCKVKKLLFLGSSCIYPKHAEQPIKEEYLMTGPLEITNEAYATAKIAGIKMCQAYNKQYGTNNISCMPTNLYGPGDNFHEKNSHVLPGLLRKFHESKSLGKDQVVVWGTGTPLREFLHVDDLAQACILLMSEYNSSEIINVGVGNDITIANLAELIAKITGFKGTIVYDKAVPDGTPRKLLDISRISKLGWKPRIGLESGIIQTHKWCVENSIF